MIREGQKPTPPGMLGLVQRWERLLFLHWPVSADRIRPLIHERLSVDTFKGMAYVTL